jgi:hypothetical protein
VLSVVLVSAVMATMRATESIAHVWLRQRSAHHSTHISPLRTVFAQSMRLHVVARVSVRSAQSVALAVIAVTAAVADHSVRRVASSAMSAQSVRSVHSAQSVVAETSVSHARVASAQSATTAVQQPQSVAQHQRARVSVAMHHVVTRSLVHILSTTLTA